MFCDVSSCDMKILWIQLSKSVVRAFQVVRYYSDQLHLQNWSSVSAYNCNTLLLSVLDQSGTRCLQNPEEHRGIEGHGHAIKVVKGQLYYSFCLWDSLQEALLFCPCLMQASISCKLSVLTLNNLE